MLCSGGRMATIGTFDGVHRGHLSVLADLKARCAAEGLEPLVVTFDRHPLQVVAPERAPQLLMSCDERFAMLRQIVPHLAVLEFNEQLKGLKAAEFMAMLRRDWGVEALLLGFNHRFGSDGLRSFEEFELEAKSVGIRVFQSAEMADEATRYSSTIVRKALKRGDVAAAARCLNRPYRIVGNVTTGKQLGRKIGFPTANVVPVEQRQLVPMPGVYACMAQCSDGSRHRAMVNIGVRPTVDESGCTTIEAHLLDFAGNLYGSALTLDFIERLRDERRFASIDELTAQLHHDRKKAKSIFDAAL